MNFQPNTSIWFCHTGITDNHKIYCKDEDELFQTITREGNVTGRMQKCSFQRADGFFIIRADHKIIPYYLLMQCDTVIYKNEEQTGAFWIVGNIVGVDWKNEDCSFVRFVIDPFMTYQVMVDWDKTYAYIEREHVKEDWSASGNPLFSNMGPGEDFGTKADTPIFAKTFNYDMSEILVQSPYNTSGKPVFEGEQKNGMYSGMQSVHHSTETANQFFNTIAESKEASINNIVGVYALPTELAAAINRNIPDKQDELQSINIAGKANPNVPDYNNAKCWSSPFCVIRLMSSTGDTMDFTPQWFGNDISEYSFLRRARITGGQFGGIAGTFKNKNGIFDWKAWSDFTVLLNELPRCYWTADGFTDWDSYARTPLMLNNIGSALRVIGSIGGTITNPPTANFGGHESVASQSRSNIATQALALTGEVGGALQAVGSGIAPILQHKATGSTVSGGGSFSGLFDVGQEAWGFKIVYYMAQPYAMNCVDQYFDRFGYRVSKLKKLALDNRPIWNYLQTSECHVTLNTGIPYIYETAINNIFNRGVTIWNREKYMAGRKIGDYSNPKENKGIQGG